jgi:hypothetical protein
MLRILRVRSPRKTANVADVALVALIRNKVEKLNFDPTYYPTLSREFLVMKSPTDNPRQLANLTNASRCGAKTRSGGICRSPTVKGRRRCRMHGGTNNGAPKGNSNARRHGNRSAEAEEQLKNVKQTDRNLRVLSKVRRGLDLTTVERDRLIEIFVESRRQNARQGDPTS